MAQLTRREYQIARHVRLGYTNKQIGAHLGLTPDSVKNRVIYIAGKLGAQSANKRVEVATWYIRNNR